MGRIIGFFHTCAINSWHSVVSDQIDVIVQSGLYAATAEVSTTILGPEDAQAVFAKHSKFIIRYHSTQIRVFERPTLARLWRHCFVHPEDFVWYIHSKGVSLRNGRNPCVQDWRKYMEYFVLERWQDCLHAIEKEGCDVCGVNWQREPWDHFSGNFWWARADYVRRLSEAIPPGYLECERWIGRGKPRVKSFWNSAVNHYLSRYPRSNYTST